MKTLLSILGRPWLMEPRSAEYWGKVAENFIFHGKEFSNRERLSNLPTGDKRKYYTYSFDFGPAFRVDHTGALKTNGSIQVFRIDAPIMKGDYCGTPGTQTLVQLLQAASEDKTVEAVLFWCDSPGGQVDGTERLAKAIKACSKPTVAYGDGQVCSAMYWIASSCDYLIVDDSNNGWNAEIGSIGTLCQWEDNTKEKESRGIIKHIVFADASSDKWGDFFKANAGDYTELKKSLNAINETFLSAVKSNRGDKLLLGKENTLTGKVYNANDAVAFGLADAKGSFTDSVKMAVKLTKQQKNKIKMESNNSTPFENVLIAAKAESFPTTDEGFVMSEEQLKDVDAVLVAKDKEIERISGEATTATDQVKELEGQLEAANAKTVELEESLGKATEKENELKGQIEQMENEPGTFFRNVNKKKDTFKSEDYNFDAADHNKAADAILHQ